MNRLSIANLLPGLVGTNNDGEPMDVDKPETWAPKHGPAKARWITGGQMRRRHFRDRATQSRKANVRYRKTWMKNQREVAALRGQLITVAAIRTNSTGGYLIGQTGSLMENAHKALEAKYGSVEAATEHYQSILAERR